MANVGIDKAAYKKMIEKSAQRRGVFRFPKKGSTHLRILKYGNEGMFSVEVPQHQRKTFSTGETPLGVCPKAFKNQPCAICKVNEMAIETGAEPGFRTNYKYAVNAIDVNDDAQRVQLWLLPSSVHEDIVNTLLEDEWEDALEPNTGVCFTIKREGTGLDTNYTVMPQRKPYKVGKKLLSQVIDPEDKIVIPSLETQCENIGADLSDLFSDDEIEKLETETKKGKKGKGSAVTKIKVNDEVFYGDEVESCKVTKISGDTATIEDVNGDTFDVEIADLRPTDEIPEPEKETGDDVIVVGSDVRYLEEEGVCTVETIDNDDIVIKDENGDTYDVTRDELTLVTSESESGGDEIKVGCIVKHLDETEACKVNSIDGDSVEIEDGKGDTYDVGLDDLTFVQEDDTDWPF